MICYFCVYIYKSNNKMINIIHYEISEFCAYILIRINIQHKTFTHYVFKYLKYELTSFQ